MYNIPFMDYIIFELSFLVIASQVTFYRYTFRHLTKMLKKINNNKKRIWSCNKQIEGCQMSTNMSRNFSCKDMKHAVTQVVSQGFWGKFCNCCWILTYWWSFSQNLLLNDIFIQGLACGRLKPDVTCSDGSTVYILEVGCNWNPLCLSFSVVSSYISKIKNISQLWGTGVGTAWN